VIYKSLFSAAAIAIFAFICSSRVVYSDGLSGAYAKDAAFNDSPPYYNRGADRGLCKEIRKLLVLQKNKDYLFSQEKLSGMSLAARQKEWRARPLLFVPQTEEFKNFTKPIWKDIDADEARNQLSEFIRFVQERPEFKGVSVELGKDYKIQVAQIDMNLDGAPETVFRSIGLDGNSLGQKESITNFLSINFKRNSVLIFPGLFLQGQIVLYKGMPVFLNREFTLTTLSVVPSLENGDILTSVDSRRRYKPLGCTLSSTSRQYLGD